MIKKLQILIPQYKETDEIIKPLLDSIALQQNVDFKQIGVIIVNDGSDVFLSDKFLKKYPFKIEYYKEEHRGVSATRQSCFEHSNAEYVMWCDADDMFYNMCGLWIILTEIERSHFDSMVSVFIEEGRMPETKEVMYINREMDSTFVHGKVHKSQYLRDKNIKWNPKLTIHEDSFFNTQCQKYSQNVVYCQSPFYLWKWRDDSVCRHDPKYILKTYNNLLDSNTELIHEFLNRELLQEARFYATSMILDAWLTMNTKDWLNQENQAYRNATEKRFKQYYDEFKKLSDGIDEQTKNQIVVGIRNRFFAEGLIFEEITFKDWIAHIETLK